MGTRPLTIVQLPTILVLALLTPLPLRADPIEFRSEGFFASPDARVKFFRESWRYCPHLDVDGQLAMYVEGPILRPGYNTLDGATTKTELDPARRQMVDVGAIGKFSASCRRTISECQGGMLIRLEYGPTPPEVNEADCRLILPIDFFKSRRIRWEGGEIVLPGQKPDDKHLTFLNDSNGQTGQFRFELGQGRELGVKFLSPIKGVLLADCRQWNETNYHLQAKFSGKTMLLFMCLLKPEDPFPVVERPSDPTKASPVTLSDQGAAFSALDGLYDIRVAKSGQLQVQKNGNAVLDIEPPCVQEKDTTYRLDEQEGFETKEACVEVISKSTNKPFRLRQSFSMEEDGWLSVTAKFEGLETAQRGQVELSLPAKRFAGKTVRAAERFFKLPKDQSPEVRLLDDWKGRMLDYELPLDNSERLTLFCDQKATTLLGDYRKWNQPSIKIGMTPKDAVVRYRLHFWKEDEPPACVKGNLLHDGASFEAGPEGVRPYACFSWYDKMVEPGVPPAFDATTAVHGTTSLCLTAGDSQKLGNPHEFAFVGAAFNRVALQRDRKYTVSAYLKADRPGVKAVIYCGESTWAGEDWGPFNVGTEWKRYDFSFFTADFKKTGYYLTWVGLDPGCKQGKLWIDAVQLEEGDLSEFQPAAEVEYGVEVPISGKLFDDGAPCSAILRVRNNDKKPLSGNVKFVVKDYWEQPARTGSVAVNVPPKSNAAYPVDLGTLPCGYYRGHFTTPAADVKEIIFGVYKPQPLTPLPDDWPLACHNDPMPLVRKLGFGSVRAFEIFEFAGIAPRKGKFDFSRADRMVKRAEECGLTIMPILSEFAWPDYRADPPVPPYAQEKVSENVLEDGRRVRLAWPTMEAWKDYVRALTSRYKGKINYWEVMNEPNLIMTAQQYTPYLQAAFEAAKQGNPDCQVVGVCGTSDFAGKPNSFTDSVLKLGGAKEFDILSVHLYDTHMPEQTLGTGSDQLLDRWRKTMKETYGREVPVWHTERSFSCREMTYSSHKVNVPVEYCGEPQFLIDTFQHKAEYMIRETLLDSVAGGGRFFWFGQFDYETCFITVRYFEPYGLDHVEFDQSPCPELIAANGLARVLDGMSHPYRQISLGDAVRCCVFTGEKGSVAALWNCKTKGPIILNLRSNKYVLHNFFGEPIAAAANEKGEVLVELEGAPKYLSLPGLDGESCCGLLKR
jgi:hypothetical protein